MPSSVRPPSLEEVSLAAVQLLRFSNSFPRRKALVWSIIQIVHSWPTMLPGCDRDSDQLVEDPHHLTCFVVLRIGRDFFSFNRSSR